MAQTQTQTAAPVLTLAREFSRVLAETIGAENLAEAVTRNATPEYGPGCCASHDFCDANMAMLDAWCNVHGIDSETFDFAETMADADNAAQWSAAWDAAKAAGFQL